MILQKAQRQKAKIKMALQSPSGGGKTYSALLVAYGLCNDWSKIAVIDTENHSADLYSHLGNYNCLSLTSPYSPDEYIKAITLCENAGMEVIIIDSISHCWNYLLEYHASLQGNSFANWAKVNPRQKVFIDKILSSNCHIISTLRVKQDYVINEKNGKYIPEKIGLKAIQREGLDYEFTIVFDLNANHYTLASKDRTELFIDKPEFKITVDTGRLILDWCNKGSQVEEKKSLPITEEQLKTRINDCKSLKELFELYNLNPAFQQNLLKEFQDKKKSLEPTATVDKNIINTKPLSSNGTYNS